MKTFLQILASMNRIMDSKVEIWLKQDIILHEK